ncbi:MAG: FAD:protein FMN transferase [Proteobacteria bacterium]|nr:FAD:protein FMN transferase [Pseudomonadota bacterium]
MDQIDRCRRRMRPLLGTFVEVAAAAPAPAQADAAIDAAFAALQRAQALWSVQDPASELSRLNRAPPGQPLALSAATLRLLKIARALMRASAGAFDVTGGSGGSGSAEDLLIGPRWALRRGPLTIDLDGIAKGFAVDLGVAALRRHGAEAGWINAGGDLRAFGALTLPLQRRGADGRLQPLGGLRDAALATSWVPAAGDEANAAHFPARIRSGGATPAAPGVWTVIARSAWRADALTKVAACSPAAQRAEAVRRLGGRWIDAPAEAAA